jgi:hypothetical protein
MFGARRNVIKIYLTPEIHYNVCGASYDVEW